MMDVLEKAVEWLDEGQPVAVLTVVRSRGSTPRHLAAKMVVRADGETVGSVGGGSLEYQAQCDALEALAADQPRLVDYSLIARHEGSVGLCGGTQEVFIDVISPRGGEFWRRDLVRAALDALAEGESSALVTVVRAGPSSGVSPGAKLLVRCDGAISGDLRQDTLQAWAVQRARKALEVGESCRLSFVVGDDGELQGASRMRGDVEVFIDVLQPRPRLLIVGAGHIGLALMRLGRMLDMHVQVLDDRPEFVDPSRVAEADEVFLADYDPQTEELAPLPVQITPSTYVVVATWGWDEPVLLQIAESGAAYIGLVASLRKARILFDHLVERGVSREALARVQVPVGLDLGAETAAEIAVSIMAEILMMRHGGLGRPLAEVKGQRLA